MTKHKSKQTKDFYKVVDGKLTRTEKMCDRCGSGTFMAEHNDRFYCGKCAMTVWKKKEVEIEKK